MKDYRLILKTQLDVTAIQSQIDALQKKISKTNFSVGAGKSKGAIKIVDAQAELRSLDQIYARIKELGGKNVQTTSITGKLGNTTGEIIKYRNAQNDVITESYKLEKATKKQAEGFSLVTREVKGSVKSISTWTDGLSSAAQRTLQYATSTAILYGAFNQLRQGIQYIIDLNKQMVNIQVVTGNTDSEINALAVGYNNLAKEMGATTIEIAKGSLEFVRQGKTAEETAILIKNSTMMAKLGNMDMAESSEALTSIMNGFKLSAEETGDVVNRLLAIDNVAATSIMELSTAMRYSSNSAQQVGVDMQHLAAYIGTVSSVTRLSEETIGQAFKTIFSRMTAIKDMKAFDSEGEIIDVSKVEDSLRRVGIQLRDGNKQFRNMQDVLTEIGEKWDEIAPEEQLNIAQQIANVRQKETFLVLMNNQLEMQKQLNAEADSSGLKEERYLTYLKGVEAAQNNLRSSWEKLVMSSSTSDFISDIYNLGAGILDLTNKMGGLKTVLIAVAVAYAYLNWGTVVSVFTGGLAAVSALAVGLKTLVGNLVLATNAQWALNFAADVNPYILLASAIALVVGGLIVFSATSEKARKEIEKINTTVSEMESKLSTMKSDKNSLKTLIEDYEKLGKIAERTAEQEQEFIDTQNAIKDILPLVAGEFDDLGNYTIAAGESMTTLSGIMDENIARQERLIQLENEKKISPLVETSINSARELTKALETYDYYDKKLTEGALLRERYLDDASDSIEKNKLLMEQTIIDMTDFYNSLDESGQRRLLSELGQDVDGKKIAEGILKAVQEGIDSSPNKPEVPIKTKIDVELELNKLIENKDFQSLVDEVVNMLKDIKKQEKENIQQQLSDYKQYIDTLKQGYRDRLDEEKRLYDIQKTNLQRQHEDYLDNLETEFDALKRNYDEQIESLKRLHDQETKNRENAKEAIQDELDGYLDIISAQERSLDLRKAEDEYNRNKAKKEQDLASLEAQILALSFDNSADGIAKRLELEAQAAELRTSLTEDALDRQYELEQQALEEERRRAEEEAQLRIQALEQEQEIADQEYEMRLLELEDALEKAKLEYEENKRISDKEYEMRLREMEDKQEKSQQEYDMQVRRLEDQYAAKEANFQNEIKLLDDYLSQEGLLNKEAMDLILDENSGVYEDLMEWNRVYGTGIQNDIIAMWDLAKIAVDDYKNAIMEVSALSVPTPFPNTGGFTPYEGEQPDPADVIHSHHTGIEKGAVGGQKLKSSEEFIKAMKGEVLITPRQMSNFTGNILPSMMNKPKGESTFSGGGATFEKLFDIVIQGNLDKSTLPDLERLSTQIIDKINKGMQQRGMLRNTNLNAI